MLHASTSQQITPPHNIVTSGDPEALRLLLEATLNRLHTPQTPPGWDSLNAYRRDILRLTADGLTNAQIGNRLCRTEKAINKQKTGIVATLGLTGTGWHCLSRYVAEHKPFLRSLSLTTEQKK